MLKLLHCILLLAFSSATSWAAEIDNKSLDIGVVPYGSARVIVMQYEPMRQYLEHVMGRPVKIFTAPSFRQFLVNAQKGDYDIALSPAHFARILQKDNHYTPLSRYAAGGRGLIMVAKDSPLKSVDEIRGKTLALPFSLSLAAIVCLTELKDKNLRPDVDFKVLEVPSFESAIIAIDKGDAIAAVSAPGALTQMNEGLRSSVRPILDTGNYTNLIFMGKPELGKKNLELLHAALLKFNTDMKDGKAFFEATGFGNMLNVTSSDMNALDRYLHETRRLLNSEQ